MLLWELDLNNEKGSRDTYDLFQFFYNIISVNDQTLIFDIIITVTAGERSDETLWLY